MQLFSHRNQDTQHRPWSILRVVLISCFVLVLSVFGVLSLGSHQVAHAAGWTQIWGDDFTGTGAPPPAPRTGSMTWAPAMAARGAPIIGAPARSSQTPTAPRMSISMAVGHLAIKPIRDGNGNWTSGASRHSRPTSRHRQEVSWPSRRRSSSQMLVALPLPAIGQHFGCSAPRFAASIPTGPASARSISWKISMA